MSKENFEGWQRCSNMSTSNFKVFSNFFSCDFLFQSWKWAHSCCPLTSSHKARFDWTLKTQGILYSFGLKTPGTAWYILFCYKYWACFLIECSKLDSLLILRKVLLFINDDLSKPFVVWRNIKLGEINFFAKIKLIYISFGHICPYP